MTGKTGCLGPAQEIEVWRPMIDKFPSFVRTNSSWEGRTLGICRAFDGPSRYTWEGMVNIVNRYQQTSLMFHSFPLEDL